MQGLGLRVWGGGGGGGGHGVETALVYGWHGAFLGPRPRIWPFFLGV